MENWRLQAEALAGTKERTADRSLGPDDMLDAAEERRGRREAEELLRQAQVEYRRAESDWNALSEQVEEEIEANRERLEEATSAADRLYAANREMLDRVDQAVAERDEARAAYQSLLGERARREPSSHSI